nr:uncharacterized protein LOC108122963 [Drosophila bipectinata]
MCIPLISRADLYDIALVAGIKTIIRQMEGFNEDKPLSTDLIAQITNMASNYFLGGRNVRFVLQMLFLACRINKPRPGQKPEYDVEADAEKSFVCLLQNKVEKCYSYSYNPEEDIYPEIDKDKKPESAGNATVAARSWKVGHARPRFRSIASSSGHHHKKRFHF